MGDKLRGKVAVVTGSGQGIGRAIAVAIAKEGAKVVTNNRCLGSTGAFTYNEAFEKSLSEEQREWVCQKAAQVTGDAETTAKQIRGMGSEAVAFFGDVSDFKVARQLMQTAVDHFGKIDILVNNAGAFRHSSVWEMTEEAWDLEMNSHLKGSFNCIRHACPFMMKQKLGRIINCTSGSFLGMAHHSNYSAVKAGIVGLTRALAKELYPYGITCNAFAPAAMTRAIINVITLGRQLAEAGSPVWSEERLKRIGASPSPEAIGPFIAYLATDETASINGAVFYVRGPIIGIYSEPEIRKTIEKEEGFWTVDELVEEIPKVLLEGYQSPAAAQLAK
jgi:3-oxoacyl-[acyl-carrier protein] reductase